MFQTMKHPLEHLQYCKGNHYRLQLNCHKYILEKYYNKRVVSMRVVCTHPDNGESAFIDDVPDLRWEVEEMMAYQRTRAVS